MKNNKDSDKSNRQIKTESNQPAAPQMEKDQPVVNEQEQIYPVNPQDDMFRQDTSNDFISEQDMNRIQQTDTENSTKNQGDDYDTNNADSEIEETDDTSVKTPKVNP